jgi:hypothetical protein
MNIKDGSKKIIKSVYFKYGLSIFHIFMAIFLFIKAVTTKNSHENSKLEYVLGHLILIFGTLYGILLILGNS